MVSLGVFPPFVDTCSAFGHAASVVGGAVAIRHDVLRGACHACNGTLLLGRHARGLANVSALACRRYAGVTDTKAGPIIVSVIYSADQWLSIKCSQM